MLPQKVLSTLAVTADFKSPRDRYKQALIDYELGGVDLNDPSEGLEVKVWTAQYVSPYVVLSADGVADNQFLEQLGIVELSFTFDQNMQPFIAYTLSDETSAFYWFDSTVPGFVTTTLSAGSRNLRASLDDKRDQQTAISDIILAYIRDTKLYFRAQDDRYDTEYELYTLADMDKYELGRVGMNTLAAPRFQFELRGRVLVYDVEPIPNPTPTLSSISPTSTAEGGGSFTLTVTGTNFVNDSVVRWNGADRSTTFNSETELEATILAGDIASQGTADVTVFNPSPGGGETNAIEFTIEAGGYETVVLADSPEGYWRLEETSGTSAADSSGNSHDGTYVGGPNLDQAGLLDDDANRCVDFNSGDYVSTSWTGVLGTSAFSIEAWVQTDAEKGVAYDGTITSWGDPVPGGKCVFRADQRRPRLEVASGYKVFEGNFCDGYRHHVVVTHPGGGANVSSAKCYIDGVEVAQDELGSRAVDLQEDQTVTIGHDPIAGSRWWEGKLDEVAIYSTELSAATVRAHYVAGFGDAVAPDQIANLATWYDPDDLALSDGDPVNSWAAGAGDEAPTLTDTGTAMTYIAASNTVSSRSGTDKQLAATSVLGNIDIDPNDLTVCYVINPATNGTYRPIIFGATDTSVPCFAYAMDGTLRFNNGSLSFTTPPVDELNVITIRKTGDRWDVWIGQEPVRVNADHALGSTVADDLWLGDRVGTGDPANCDVGDLVFFDRSLSNNEVAQIVEYMLNKWSLT